MLSQDSAPLSLVKQTHPAVKWKVSMCESCPESNKVFLYLMDFNDYSGVLSYKILGLTVITAVWRMTQNYDVSPKAEHI